MTIVSSILAQLYYIKFFHLMIKNLSNSFICWYCEKNLTDNRYVIKDGFAVCLSCFEEKYSNLCFKCNQIIGIETQVRLNINKNILYFLIFREVYFKIKHGIIVVLIVRFVIFL